MSPRPDTSERSPTWKWVAITLVSVLLTAGAAGVGVVWSQGSANAATNSQQDREIAAMTENVRHLRQDIARIEELTRDGNLKLDRFIERVSGPR